MKQKEVVSRHVCPRNCQSSCSLLGFTLNGRLMRVEGDLRHGYTKGKLCSKGYSYVDHVYHPERIKYPMIQTNRGSGHWQRISWEKAIDLISKKILKLYERYEANLSLCLNRYSGNMGILHKAIDGFFNSLGPTTRAVGSPCWSSGLDAAIYDFGGILTSDLNDMMNSQVIVLWGTNPAWTSIHAMHYLYKAKEKGAKIIVIDPVYTATAKKADLYIQVRPGSDGALALAVVKYIVKQQWQNQLFIDQYVEGWEEYKQYIEGLDEQWLLEECGQGEAVVIALAQHFTQGATMSWVGYGLQRNQRGGQNIRAINSLNSITGNIGKEGCGVQYASFETLDLGEQITQYYQPGYDENNSIRAINMNDFAKEVESLAEPPVKFLWISCRNLVTQDGNRRGILDMMKQLEMVVTVDSFMTETALYSDIVLPSTTNFEEWDIVPSYWHHWLSINQPAIAPYYESKSDLDIIRLLAKRLNELKPGFSTFPYEKKTLEFIEEEFTAEIMELFQLNHWRELLEQPKKANLPMIAWEDKQFKTPSGRIELYSKLALEKGQPPMATYDLNEQEKTGYFLIINHSPFTLNSQFHDTGKLKQHNREPVIYLPIELAKEKGIVDGRMVRVFNQYGSVVVKAKVSNEIVEKVVVGYGNYQVFNQLITTLPTDLGELSTGYKGMAFNETIVQVELY